MNHLMKMAAYWRARLGVLTTFTLGYWLMVTLPLLPSLLPVFVLFTLGTYRLLGLHSEDSFSLPALEAAI